MPDPLLRWIQHPVDPRDWKSIVGQLLDRPRAPAGRRKPGKGAADASEFTAKQQEFVEAVTAEGRFCVLRTDDKNVTNRFNTAMQAVARDGCLSDGSVLHHDGADYFVRLMPRLLTLTDTTINQAIPPEDRTDAHGLRQAAGRGSVYVVVWGTKRFIATTTIYTAADIKKLKRGAEVPPPPEDGYGLVVVASARHARFVDQLKSKAGNPGLTLYKVVASPRQRVSPTHLGQAQAAAATVIYVDPDVDDCHLMSFGTHSPTGHLILVADDPESARRVRDLADQVGPPSPQVFVPADGESGAPSLAAVVRAVAVGVELARQAKHASDKSATLWRGIRAGMAKLLASDVEPGLTQAAVLDPFRRRVDRAVDGKFVSSATPQTEFIHVATPLYNQAVKVYALNTDQHSTFWDHFKQEEKDQFLVKEAETVRLCLYGDTGRAGFRLGELVEQARSYGHHADEGGTVKLLVGELAAYRGAYADRVKEDTAFIQLKTGTWYKFLLSRDRFSATRIGAEVDDPLFDRLKAFGKDAHAGYTLTANGPGGAFPYFRWTPGVLKQPKPFERCMKDVFLSKSQTGVHRILMFRNDDRIHPGRFESIVRDVHDDLQRRRLEFQEFGLRWINFGSVRPESGEPPTRHVLILQFDTKERLSDYEECEPLKDIRRRLYARLYRAIWDGAKVETPSQPAESDKEAHAAAEIMLTAGSRYVTIRNYTDQRPLDHWIEWLRKQHAD